MVKASKRGAPSFRRSPFVSEDLLRFGGSPSFRRISFVSEEPLRFGGAPSLPRKSLGRLSLDVSNQGWKAVPVEHHRRWEFEPARERPVWAPFATEAGHHRQPFAPRGGHTQRSFRPKLHEQGGAGPSAERLCRRAKSTSKNERPIGSCNRSTSKGPLRRGHSGDPGIKHRKAASRKLCTVVSIDNMGGGISSSACFGCLFAWRHSHLLESRTSAAK
jgi:hypothetical protein